MRCTEPECKNKAEYFSNSYQTCLCSIHLGRHLESLEFWNINESPLHLDRLLNNIEDTIIDLQIITSYLKHLLLTNSVLHYDLKTITEYEKAIIEHIERIVKTYNG